MKTLTIATLVGLAGLSTITAAAEKIITPWSYQPLKRPVVPAATAAVSVGDDLDRFVLAGLQQQSLGFNPRASRQTLLRRATLDLHGLLPTEREMDDFSRDPSNDEEAFATVVDRLLRSPRFGERWARHWLDVVRYADSVGRLWNAPFTHAFQYRDYVIDSLNADKPYDRFIMEQLAGDLLPAQDDAARRQAFLGTGMLALGCMDLTSGMQEAFIMDRIDDQIDVTSRAFLGLTVACARCHDHKTDPIKQSDYYAMAGVFYSSDTWSGTAHKADLGPNLYVDPDRLMLVPSSSRSTTAAGAPKVINAMDDNAANQMTMVPSGKRPVNHVYDPALAMGITDGKPVNCPIRVAGDAYDEGPAPRRGEMEIPLLPPLPKAGPRESGRLQLAQWIATPTHPLTARVMVNRLWAHLFGQGIVKTVDDFGITGEKPSNPQLLDHLAVRFVEGKWSIKTMLRHMMLSTTYTQSGGVQPAATDADPGNELRWRMQPRRIEMEVLRDTLLQLSGKLTEGRPSGIQVAGNGGKGNTARTQSLLPINAPCRTIYLPVLRDLLPPMFETWDFPNPSQIKGARDLTTVPSQALFLMNNDFIVDCAEEIAWNLLEEKELSQDDARVAALWRRIYSREPAADETTAALQMLRDLEPSSELKDPDLYRWRALVQALLASAEFRYVL
ncbi:MAG: DUF1553 domain-containing protein [Verrucomicrobiales bacterium]|nr:DUF1553 domain-containing protein [Verrucomicrobiales bacterium]MCP5560219.1 DUF1553 domain-containing protein [Verrucomicrobiaceae bacterium]